MSSLRPGPIQYQARADREPSFGETEIAAACMYLETWFEARHRTRYCDMILSSYGRQIHFDILHGKEPSSNGVEGEPLETKLAAPATDDRSFALYDEETRTLVVRALDFIKEGIRTSFGHGFCGDADFFERGAGSTSAPPATVPTGR
jgi:hypothetical protein